MKRKGSNADGNFDEITVNGVRIPHALRETPIYQLLQLGITVGQMQKRHIDAAETGARIGNAAAERIPGFETGRNLLGASESENKLGTLAASEAGTLVPQGLQDVARYLDRKPDGEVRKVDTTGFWNALLSTVPEERNKLPRKPLW